MSETGSIFGTETKYFKESIKRRKTAIWTTVISCVIALSELAIDVFFCNANGVLPCAAWLAVFLLLFAATYKFSANVILLTVNILWIPWMMAQVSYFGWKISSQQLVTLMIIMVFFCTYMRIRYKSLIAIILLCFRVILFEFSGFIKASAFNCPQDAQLFIQFVISACVTFGIGATCVIYCGELLSQEDQLVKYNIQLENEANTDALTGLYNRRRMLEKLEKFKEDNLPGGFCVAMCDVDFFKKVNDNYGHDVGDEVLKKIALTMQEVSLDKAVAGRWGGEEFLFAFPEMNGDQAQEFLFELVKRIRALRFTIGEKEFGVTMTIGLAEYDYKSDIDTLIKEADEKMYRGKENGRNQIVF